MLGVSAAAAHTHTHTHTHTARISGPHSSAKIISTDFFLKKKRAAAARIVWTPLFGEDHLQVKALASLQLDTYVYCGHTSGAYE